MTTLKAVVPHVIKVRPAAVKPATVTPETAGAPVVLIATPGAPGASAYQLAVAAGFSGDETEWLASLKGEPGADGRDGTDGSDGADGSDGVDGLSITSDDGEPSVTQPVGTLYVDAQTGDLYRYEN